MVVWAPMRATDSSNYSLGPLDQGNENDTLFPWQYNSKRKGGMRELIPR